MKNVWCFVFVLSLSLSVKAQDEHLLKDSIVIAQVIQNMFTAINKSDTNLLKTCFTPTSILQTIANKNGIIEIKTEQLQNFISSIGIQKPGALDERIKIDKLLIDAELASVWTPYEFYYNQKYSHKGVNSFQLVKRTDGWKIQYIIDTRRK